ncbi:hypothetical protein B0H19DRAFT_1237519 [Mycena capillaripes]|nr:hypothetical protein B0H19DRAFT_1237519 [Mycena capillaripes]
MSLRLSTHGPLAALTRCVPTTTTHSTRGFDLRQADSTRVEVKPGGATCAGAGRRRPPAEQQSNLRARCALRALGEAVGASRCCVAPPAEQRMQMQTLGHSLNLNAGRAFRFGSASERVRTSGLSVISGDGNRVENIEYMILRHYR